MYQVTNISELASATVPNAAAAVYTVPASTSAIVKGLYLYNDSAGTVEIQIWAVPSGGSRTLTTKRYTISIATKTTYNLEGSPLFALAAAGAIHMVADTATAVSVSIIGVEFQSV